MLTIFILYPEFNDPYIWSLYGSYSAICCFGWLALAFVPSFFVCFLMFELIFLEIYLCEISQSLQSGRLSIYIKKRLLLPGTRVYKKPGTTLIRFSDHIFINHPDTEILGWKIYMRAHLWLNILIFASSFLSYSVPELLGNFPGMEVDFSQQGFIGKFPF